MEHHEIDDLTSLVGQVIAKKYKLTKAISEGGMGQIYLATHLLLGEPRAIKLLHPELLVNQNIRKRFINEFKLTHKISKKSHHIVEIYDDFAFEDGLGYYAMEYLEGRTLKDAIEEAPGQLPISWCIRIARQICTGMQQAHEGGVIHRDLKPANIFLIEHKGERDYVKILDFGIAKDQDRQGTELTQMGSVVGTLPYMAPEQITGVVAETKEARKDIDGRVDIYALGCILQEMLTGQPPFTVDGPNTPLTRNALLIAHLQEPPPPLRQLRPDAPQALEDILCKALAKRPDDRFASMDLMALALAEIPDEARFSQPFTGAIDHNAIPLGTRQKPLPTSDNTRSSDDNAALDGDQGSKRLTVILALAVLLLLGLGGVAYWWTQKSPTPTTITKRRVPTPTAPKESPLDALFRKGQRAFMNKAYSKAAVTWRKAMLLPGWKKSKYHPQLYLGVANALAGARLIHPARRFYRRYTKVAPRQDPERKKIEGAILPQLNQQLKANKRQAARSLDALTKALKRDRYREAARLFFQSQQQAPSIPAVQFRRAQLIAARFPVLAAQTQKRLLALLEPNKTMRSRAQAALQALQKTNQRRSQEASQVIAQSLALLQQNKTRWKAQRLFRKKLDLLKHLTLPATHKTIKDASLKLAQRAPDKALQWLALYARKLAKFDQKGLRSWMGKAAKDVPQPTEVQKQRQALRRILDATRLMASADNANAKGRFVQAYALYKRASSQWQKARALDVWGMARQFQAQRDNADRKLAALKRITTQLKQAQQLDRQAQFAQARSAYEQWLNLIKGHPSASRWKARLQARLASFQRAAKHLRQGTRAYKREQWKSAIKHLKAYEALFPHAHNRAAIKKMRKIGECRLGTPWKLCHKLYK